jgi:UDP-3-O-[3-hydroxymyristoyl] glucosamine N-acyltransferase
MRVEDLARVLQAELDGERGVEVHACATLDDAQPGQVTFLTSPKYAPKLGTTKASAVIVAEGFKRPAGLSAVLIRAKDAYFAFRNAVVALHGERKHPDWGTSGLISPLAFVHPTASIGEGTVVYPFVFIGPRAKVGKNCILYPSVTVYDDCIVGDRVILHAGCSIGQDGFGHATHALPGKPPEHHKIPQAGNAVIEDDVEMGANCSIDRATLGSTVVGRGTKFSNNVVIGHGTKVGPHNLYVAQVGLAGSVTTGSYVVMGGQAGVAGHLAIADQVQIAAQSGVMNDLEEKGQYLGAPAMPGAQARRVYNHFLNLDEIVKRLKDLEKQVAELRPPPAPPASPV